MFYDLNTRKEWLEQIADDLEYKDDLIERLREELEAAKKETFKDAVIQDLRKRLKEVEYEIYRGFPISEEEEREIKRWKKSHELIHKGGHGAIGGKYTYSFTPTSIGSIGEITCTCGEKFCFSDI